MSAAELWQANCSILPWAVVYRSRTSAESYRFRSLFLALGLLAAACLNPKTDDLPDRPIDDTNGPSAPGVVGAAGTGAASNGGTEGAGTGDGAGGSAGSGGGAGTGSGGGDVGIPDAGTPNDAGSLANDSALGPDGGDAGTQ